MPAQTPQPAPSRAEVKAAAAAAIAAARAEIVGLSHRIHAHPEVAFQETQASSDVAAALRRHGYAVEHPFAGLPTAVRGRRTGTAGGGPTIAVLAEYDALPALGHGCGHNMMAAAGVGAAIGLAAVADRLHGSLVVMGTPAEESGSAKGMMVAAGAFDGVDAALQFHPGDVTDSCCALLALDDVEVTYAGREAHAAEEPWLGKNALDALTMLLVGIGLWRQQLRPTARVHGIVVHGGDAPNTIPSLARARFMLRAPDEDELDSLQLDFRRIAEAAGLAADCTTTVVFSGRSRTMRDNAVLRACFVRNLEANGELDGCSGSCAPSGSSDMGNVSHVVPTIHPQIAMCQEGTPAHSIAFRDASIAGRADDVVMLAATVTAQTAIDLLLDPDLVRAAWSAFRG